MGCEKTLMQRLKSGYRICLDAHTLIRRLYCARRLFQDGLFFHRCYVGSLEDSFGDEVLNHFFKVRETDFIFVKLNNCLGITKF